jgi:hypothetical protein
LEVASDFAQKLAAASPFGDAVADFSVSKQPNLEIDLSQ